MARHHMKKTSTSRTSHPAARNTKASTSSKCSRQQNIQTKRSFKKRAKQQVPVLNGKNKQKKQQPTVAFATATLTNSNLWQPPPPPEKMLWLLFSTLANFWALKSTTQGNLNLYVSSMDPQPPNQKKNQASCCTTWMSRDGS